MLTDIRKTRNAAKQTHTINPDSANFETGPDSMEKTQARLIYTGAMSGTVGRPVDAALRKRISELLKAGKKQAELQTFSARFLQQLPIMSAH